MSLDVPAGTTVFIDANILHYALVPTPPFSEHVYPLMDRLSAGEVTGVVSIQVLADAQHKTMMSLLAAQYNLPRSKLVGWAKKHPAEICALAGLTEAVQLLRSAAVRIVPLDDALLDEAARISTQYGLLTNDSLIVALIERHGITDLATNDDDFDRVPGIRVWKPRS
jgi:predicted nucleic acid-binding protein